MTSTRSAAHSPANRDLFYAAAVAGLRALDRRDGSARRFGPDADTRWASFRGALNDSDRIDFLLRDAAVTWGVGFSPAEAFGLFGLAPDEPFGPDWQPLSTAAARRYLEGDAAIVGPDELGKLMGVTSGPVQLPAITASTRLAVAGGAALVAVARAFNDRSDLSWSDQVLAVATTPVHRQLAGLLAILTGAAGRTRLTCPGDDLRATLKTAGFAQLDVAVVSPDAEAECADFARRAAGVA
jgi:hypothetical protein